MPSAELGEALRNSGRIGNAAAELSRAEGGRRINLRLSADKRSESWTEEVRAFAKRVLGLPGQDQAKVLRVTGLDPVPGTIEAVDLLKQKRFGAWIWTGRASARRR